MPQIGPRTKQRCGWQWVTGSGVGGSQRQNHECYVIINPNNLDHAGPHICGRKHNNKTCGKTHSK